MVVEFFIFTLFSHGQISSITTEGSVSITTYLDILHFRFIMHALLLGVVLVIGITSASELHSNSSKRFLTTGHLTSTQQTQIQEGFNAAKFIAEKIDKKDLAGIAGQLAGKVSSFLGALGPFVGLALSFFGGPSAELTLLKQLFTQVENRFDLIDVQFSQLRRQVAFVATQVHFTDIESNINAVHHEFTLLSKVRNLAGYKYEANEFKRTFDRTYESSGTKLFQGIIHGGLTSGGLFHEFMTFSTYDRKATTGFMSGTLNLLMKAAALEMTYAEINNDPNHAIKKQDWVSRFSQVKDKMLAIDRAIVSHYHTQMTDDVNTFAAKHPKGGLSNADFSTQLYNLLTTKVCTAF